MAKRKARIGKTFKPANDLFFDFAVKVSKTMLDLSSSHVYFILQQAFGDELDWDEASEMLEHLQLLAKIRKQDEEILKKT